MINIIAQLYEMCIDFCGVILRSALFGQKAHYTVISVAQWSPN
jgi:hypothetical protein